MRKKWRNYHQSFDTKKDNQNIFSLSVEWKNVKIITINMFHFSFCIWIKVNTHLGALFFMINHPSLQLRYVSCIKSLFLLRARNFIASNNVEITALFIVVHLNHAWERAGLIAVNSFYFWERKINKSLSR